MTRAELLALADRVEREEPSDELNWCIQEAVHPEWRRTTAEPYTTSRDDAASLMPPGYMQSIAIGDDGVACSPFRLDANHRLVAQVMGSAPTEPRARAAAALRARAMEMADD